MVEEIVVRDATVAHLDAIMVIENQTFNRDAWSVNSMRGELLAADRRYLVALTRDGAVVGYAGLLASRGAGEGDIQTIAVLPEWRGRGLARRMLEMLLGEAQSRGAREIFLEVRKDNPVAEGLYQSLGFERIGIRRGYYQPDGMDAVVMRLALSGWKPGQPREEEEAQ
ncbi:ribosomal protein S18-alanine N-acetyltransferase [Lysinibacter sp. HNR]|uniref:ribosomal protein S18-alanine N-acetyltransferase n=1 Tax=Lysinibacter sp. HNR TaxID=3031408 RepID=UPI002434D25C|nr:ribosomal protein S18-alanine N-acetyltransferase [Lysinibacter sp. HNR]WGD38654.1 ribosomal protein S18-alanine N-acetyltransferase [Lysinibacter sp. HNR]